MNRIGIIGGTGLYAMPGMELIKTEEVHTPYGKPSSPLKIGRMGKAKEIVFLPRHGAHHEILPSEINFRANIWALKALGVRQVLSVSATGSLVQEIAPGDLALADQYLDWTRGKRESSFFGKGLVGHISTAEPACSSLIDQLLNAARDRKIKLHHAKTYACVEGPRLGTRAESFFLKGAGCHLVGMTNVPEAFLAREAQLCYATIAIATDYDCWLDDPAQHVTVDAMIARYQQTLTKVLDLLGGFFEGPGSASSQKCACRRALDGAVLTTENALSSENREILAFLKE